jgi:hypothetical protein
LSNKNNAGQQTHQGGRREGFEIAFVATAGNPIGESDIAHQDDSRIDACGPVNRQIEHIVPGHQTLAQNRQVGCGKQNQGNS